MSPANQSVPSRSFEKKLASYALASAAVLAAPGVAEATIVYSGPVNVTVNNGDYSFDLSGPSSADITVSAFNFGDNVVQVFAGVDAQTYFGGSTEPEALSFGALIDPTNAAVWGDGGKLATSGVNRGQWPTDGGSAYLGFYFTGSGGPQAGWAHIATTANTSISSFTIIDYAYESEENTAIAAGDIGNVPEPSSMVMIALGGAGILALRRRRATNA